MDLHAFDPADAFAQPPSTVTTVAGSVLLMLGMGIAAAVLAGSDAVAGAGMLAVWVVLLALGLSALQDWVPAGGWWSLAAAATLSVLAQLLLLVTAPAVFMQVNFISLHLWTLLCTAALAVYLPFAPRRERWPVGLSIVGALVLVAQMPFTPAPVLPALVGGALGVLPALTVAWVLLRRAGRVHPGEWTFSAAGARSPAHAGPRNMPACPDAAPASAPISN